MSYVVSQPNSNSNPTSKYRVIKFRDFIRFQNGDLVSIREKSSHDSFEKAAKACTDLNRTAE